jgi:hypothetical protein
MAPLLEAAVEAVELESFAKGIPDLVYKGRTAYNFFKKGSKTYPTANITAAGGVTRPAFRVPMRVQSGAAIFQATGNADSLGRGTGSQWIAGDIAPIGLFSGCEITYLSRIATNGPKRSLITLRAEELKNSFNSFMQGVDAQFQSDGAGAIVQIPATATINNNTLGGTNPSSIVGLGGQANQFQEQQVVQFFAAEGGPARTTPATATVSYVDGAADTVYFSTALPTGTSTGDFVVIQGSTGALNSGVQGIYAYQVASNTGTVLNLSRSTYPGQLSTPNINKGGAAINALDPYKAEILIGRGLGQENEAVEDFVWFTSPTQQLANTQLFTNTLQGRYEAGGKVGDKAVDVAPKYMTPTFGGREVHVSYSARTQRWDGLVPATWGIIETVEPSLYDFGDGVTTMPIPDFVNQGSYLTSSIFFYNCFLNLFNSNMKAGVYFTNAAEPSVTT